jgi:hypothetical protein
MWPDKKSIQARARQNKLTSGVAVLIPFIPSRHHTLVPAVLPLSKVLLELTLWNSQQLCRHISFYLLHV